MLTESQIARSQYLTIICSEIFQYLRIGADHLALIHSWPPDVKSWTTFFTNKFEKAQKNKSYKVFSRFQTDLSLVGLNCLLYIILSQTACSGVFSITFLNCSTVIFAFSAARSIFKSPSRTSCTSIRISPMLMPSAFTP